MAANTPSGPLLTIGQVAERAGLSLQEIAPLTGPGNRDADTSRHIRRLATDKLPHIDALIARAGCQAVAAGGAVPRLHQRGRVRPVRGPHAAATGR